MNSKAEHDTVSRFVAGAGSLVGKLDGLPAVPQSRPNQRFRSKGTRRGRGAGRVIPRIAERGPHPDDGRP